MKKEAGEGTINNDTVSILSLHSQIIQKGKIYEKIKLTQWRMFRKTIRTQK